MDEQPGDEPRPVFSFLGRREHHPQQVSCHITHTTEETHDIIRGSLDQSPMYMGMIEGVGRATARRSRTRCALCRSRLAPDFCRAGRAATSRGYPNGISTSLPYATQERFVRSIVGFEKAHITQPGYAIEYDYFDPRDLRPTLETRFIKACISPGRSTAPPATKKPARRAAGRTERRARARPEELVPGAPRSVSRRAGRRPDHPRRQRALSDVHQPRRVPVAAARRQCRPAPDADRPRAGRCGRRTLGAFEAKRDAVGREQARWRRSSCAAAS